MNLTRGQALHAFTPALPATNPARFVGSRPELASSLDALQTDGMSILFHGPAGLGKTSLAAQVIKIAKGETTLLERLNATSFAPPDDARWASVSVSAGDGVSNTHDLLRSITRRLERMFPSDIPKDLVVGKFPETVCDNFRDELTGRVALALERLQRHNETKILVVVDELDRMQDTRGLATLVRELSGPQVTLLLLGISTGPEELLSDHASVARQLQVVKVDPLPDSNITDILDVGTLSLGGGIRFSSEARAL